MRLNTGIKDWKNCRNIRELEVPSQLEQTISTGMQFIDHAFGGKGMTPSTCCLFTGTPGAGKTTLMQQMANAITGTGNIALFNTAEESLYQVRKVAKRLQLEHGYIAGQDNSLPKILEHAEQLRVANPEKQLFLIIDSLQTIDDGKYSNGYVNSMSAVRSLEMITDYCKSKYAIAVIVGQVTKSGEFQGKQSLKHIVDSHCHLFIDLEQKSETLGHRIFEVQKNRFGCSGMAYVLHMNERGLKETGMLV